MNTSSVIQSDATEARAALRRLAVVALAIGMLAPAPPGPRPSPRWNGDALPVPPQQGQPWIPVAGGFPAEFLSTTEHLFRAGLADPRGCEYRAIEVGTGSCWTGDAGVVATHGWVMPAAGAAERRFVVCWNGLVYPAVSVGDPADLRTDILAAVKADEDAQAKHVKERGDFPFHRQRAYAEVNMVGYQWLAPLQACLLLRLDEQDLARRVWSAWDAGHRWDLPGNERGSRDPFLFLAEDWTWALFDRAVCAHMRGDDRLALTSFRALVPARDAVEAEAANRGMKRPDRFGRSGGQPIPYLTFLGQLPELLADQERRAREPKRGKGRQRPADKAGRVRELVRELEDVAARQSGQPGGVHLGGDPVVAALIREGDAAVEPLLTCLETDTRMTRSVRFGRDFGRYRTVIGVPEAAYAALTAIVKTGSFPVRGSADSSSPLDPEGRKRLTAAIREHWHKYRGLPEAEQWYGMLADDKAPGQWLQAAHNIVQPADTSGARSIVFGTGWQVGPPRKWGDGPALRGDPLRRRTDPTVAELMDRRIGELASRDDLRGANAMALFLAGWDVPAALPALKTQVGRCRDYLSRKDASQHEYVGVNLAELTLARVAGNDADALADYAAWVRTTRPLDLGFAIAPTLAPLWRFPDDPAVKAAAEWLFSAPESPWVPLLRNRPWGGGSFGGFPDIVTTPLLGLPAFRRRLLDDMTTLLGPGGTVEVRDGGLRVSITDVHSTGGRASPADPDGPKSDTTIAFRMCDTYAHFLARVEGMPACELYWPEARRDKAIAASAAILRQYGDRYRFSGQNSHPQGHDRARMTFPALGRPATLADVERGEAIFSLAGVGAARPFTLPTRPLKAEWVTLREYPQEVYQFNPATNRAENKTIYDQGGTVWQAEEALQGGAWRRYFGFVGHGMSRVPAEEVEFPGDYPWAKLSGGLDCAVTAPRPATPGGGDAFVPVLPVGSPLKVPVRLRNRRGIDQTVPAVYVRPSDGGPALRAGIEVHLWHSQPASQEQLLGRSDSVSWQEVRPRRTARFNTAGEIRTLKAAEETTAFELDLKDWFDAGKPGVYRLQVTLSAKDGRFADGASNQMLFSLSAP